MLYHEQAVAIKLGLEAGIYSIQDVINWADKMLEIYDYDDDLANISLAGKVSIKAMHILLNRLCREQPKHLEWEAMRQVLAKMYEQLLSDRHLTKRFCQYLDWFALQHDYDVPDDMRFMVGIEDEFSLAEQQIYGTIEECTDELISHLAKFNYP